MSDPCGTLLPCKATSEAAQAGAKATEEGGEARILRTSLPDWPAFFPRPKMSDTLGTMPDRSSTGSLPDYARE